MGRDNAGVLSLDLFRCLVFQDRSLAAEKLQFRLESRSGVIAILSCLFLTSTALGFALSRSSGSPAAVVLGAVVPVIVLAFSFASAFASAFSFASAFASAFAVAFALAFAFALASACAFAFALKSASVYAFALTSASIFSFPLAVAVSTFV